MSLEQLIDAARNGKESEVQRLIAEGVDPNESYSRLVWEEDYSVGASVQTTALHVAAENGHAEVVSLLLTQPNVNINKFAYDSEGVDGRTPLYLAAKNNHENVVNLLLELPNIEIDEETQTKFPQAVKSAAPAQSSTVDLPATGQPSLQTDAEKLRAAGLISTDPIAQAPRPPIVSQLSLSICVRTIIRLLQRYTTKLQLKSNPDLHKSVKKPQSIVHDAQSRFWLKHYRISSRLRRRSAPPMQKSPGQPSLRR